MHADAVLIATNPHPRVDPPAARGPLDRLTEVGESLRCNETPLADNLHELERAREELLRSRNQESSCDEWPTRSTAKHLLGAQWERIFQPSPKEDASQLKAESQDYTSAWQPKTVGVSP